MIFRIFFFVCFVSFTTSASVMDFGESMEAAQAAPARTITTSFLASFGDRNREDDLFQREAERWRELRESSVELGIPYVNGRGPSSRSSASRFKA